MILVSNHLQQFIPIPEEAVIRINMAWVKDFIELTTIVSENLIKGNRIYLDYPYNRSKFPKTTMSFEDAYLICNHHDIDYFAVSNIEDINVAKEIINRLPLHTEFVPKIETLNGVKNLTNLIVKCGIHTIMLDKEDLLVDVNKDNAEFFKCVEQVRVICKSLNVKLLELQGVVFIGA